MIRIPQNNILAESHFNNIKEVIKNRITKITLQRNPRLKKNNVFIPLSESNKSKLIELLDDNVLNEIITCEPNQLRLILDKYESYNTSDELSKFTYNIFVKHGYDNIQKYDFIKNIGLNTCPYCNRSYIYTLNKNEKLKPEIDHFYPKDKYPILAVSYYNLIPSCPTCNGFGAKENNDPIDKELINPYEIQDDDFKFNVEINNINIVNPITNIDEDSVDISFSKGQDGNIKIFGLNELYKEHRDIVIELYVKSQLEYSKDYKNYLKSFDKLNFSNEEINRLIICNYSDNQDLHKRPLAKLMRDVAKQFELI